MTSPNFVYVIRYGDRDHKIGFSWSPEGRLEALRPGGAERVVQTWFRQSGDARRVETLAHSFAEDWRLVIPHHKERFTINERGACALVELAVSIIDDRIVVESAHAEWLARRAAALVPKQTVPSHTAPSNAKWVGGYVCGGDLARDRGKAALIAAGVDHARIFQDRGRAGGQGWSHLRLACREGDEVLIAKDYPSLRTEVASLRAEGMTIRHLMAN